MNRTSPDTSHVSALHQRARERAASMVEYVGLGALSTMLVTGIAAALDATHGDRIAVAIVRRLVAVMSDGGG